MSFEPEGIIKRTKGKMIMLYAIVDDEEQHMASFFHEDKAFYVLEAIAESDPGLDIVDEDKKPTNKKSAKKVAKKRKAKR